MTPPLSDARLPEPLHPDPSLFDAIPPDSGRPGPRVIEPRRSRSRLDPWLRLAILSTTTLAGLATVPTRGEDARLERPRPLVQMTGAERWRLRPAQGLAVAPSTTGSVRTRAASAIPDERRNVRQVYPSLVEAR